MALKNFELFLIDVSSNAQLRSEFAADPEAAMAKYALTDQERKLVLSKDQAAIKKYVGDLYLAAISVNIP